MSSSSSFQVRQEFRNAWSNSSPVYIIFEIAWLVTGTVWLIGVDPDPKMCDKTIHVFSMVGRPHQLHTRRPYQLHVHHVLVAQVVVINFWIHILTPLLFMLCLCCTKICPFLGHCTYWNVMKVFSYSARLPFLMFLWQGAIDMWTRPVRITIVRFFLKICIGGFSKSLRYSVVAVPLGLSMISVGGHSLQVWICLLFTALLAAVYFSLYFRWRFTFDSQDCDSLVNHTDTEAMVLEANLSKEIHEEYSGILRLTLLALIADADVQLLHLQSWDGAHPNLASGGGHPCAGSASCLLHLRCLLQTRWCQPG